MNMNACGCPLHVQMNLMSCKIMGIKVDYRPDKELMILIPSALSAGGHLILVIEY